MRLTILTGLLSITTTACLADVGGGDCVGERCKNQPDAGMGSATSDCTTTNTTEKTTNLVLRTESDFANLPTGCWSLNANLRLEGTAITSLAKLGKLVDVNDLELVDTSLTTIDAKEQLKVYGSLLVSGNSKLVSLANLAVKKWDGQTQGGSFTVAYTVRNNAALTNIDALKYIQKVDGDLRITDDAKLGMIELGELTSVGGAVVVSNTAATHINFSQLTQVGRVEITTNTALTEVHGFGAAQIVGDFILRGNPALTTIGAMSSLTSIGGALTIDDNDALTDLTSLTGSMQRVFGAVTITGNANLTALGQVSHFQQVGTSTITNNAKLPNCKAVEVDHCVPNSTVTISGNLAQNNCNCWCGI